MEKTSKLAISKLTILKLKIWKFQVRESPVNIPTPTFPCREFMMLRQNQKKASCRSILIRREPTRVHLWSMFLRGCSNYFGEHNSHAFKHSEAPPWCLRLVATIGYEQKAYFVMSGQSFSITSWRHTAMLGQMSRKLRVRILLC